MRNDPVFTCPVCGYPGLKEEARSAHGTPSYDFCESCGFQFGVSDDRMGHTYDSYRADWIERGMPWAFEGIEPRPTGWDPRAQLARVCASFAGEIDVTDAVVAASRLQRDRWSDASRLLLDAVVTAVGGDEEWDEGAGENWAMVVTAEGLAAYVYMQAPLIMALEMHADRVRRVLDAETQLVVVTDRHEARLRADIDVLRKAFDFDFDEREFNPRAFTAAELWFWTI